LLAAFDVSPLSFENPLLESSFVTTYTPTRIPGRIFFVRARLLFLYQLLSPDTKGLRHVRHFLSLPDPSQVMLGSAGHCHRTFYSRKNVSLEETAPCIQSHAPLRVLPAERRNVPSPPKQRLIRRGSALDINSHFRMLSVSYALSPPSCAWQVRIALGRFYVIPCCPPVLFPSHRALSSFYDNGDFTGEATRGILSPLFV